MGKSRIKEVLFKSPCDWIKFEVKVPAASHMSGVWERQIRTARSILSSFLSKNGTQLDVGVWGRSNSQQPRLPTNHLSFRPRLSRTATHQLTMKSKVLLSPPGQLKCTPSNAGDAWSISLTNSSLAGEKSIYSVFRKDSGSGRYLVVIYTSEGSWWSKIPTFHIVHGMHAAVQHWWSSPQGSRIPGKWGDVDRCVTWRDPDRNLYFLYHPVSTDHRSLVRAARSQSRTVVVILISKLPWAT